MVGAILGFSSMAVAGRNLTGNLTTFEIMTWRSAIAFVTIVCVALWSGRTREIHTRALGLHLGRNVAHFAGQNLWLFALSLIPLSQLFALEFSTPIIVAIGASLFLRERLPPNRIIAALAGFIGILIVARPFGGDGFAPGLIAALLCAFGFAGSILFTKRLTQTGYVSVLNILFWLSTMQFVLGVICGLADGQLGMPTFADWPWVVVIALAGLGAHFSLSTALSLAPASIVSPMDFLRLPLIAVIGAIFYGESIEWTVFLGAAIIFGANYFNIVSESRPPRSAQPAKL